jgi:hypothetical protein
LLEEPTPVLSQAATHSASTAGAGVDLPAEPTPPNTTEMCLKARVAALRKYEAETDAYVQLLDELNSNDTRLTEDNQSADVRRLQAAHDLQGATLSATFGRQLKDEEESHARALKLLEKTHAAKKQSLGAAHAETVAECERRLQTAIWSAKTDSNGTLSLRIASRRLRAANVHKRATHLALLRKDDEDLLQRDPAESLPTESLATPAYTAPSGGGGWGRTGSVPPMPSGSWLGQRSVDVPASADASAAAPAAVATADGASAHDASSRRICIANLPRGVDCQDIFNLCSIYCNPLAVSARSHHLAQHPRPQHTPNHHSQYFDWCSCPVLVGVVWHL